MSVGELTKFRDTIRRIMPPWLQGFYGYRYLYAIAVHVDAFGDVLNYAVRSRFPNLYTPETLAITGRDRGIRRGASENDASYAARLRIWWDSHRRNGNPYTLMRQIAGYLSPSTTRMRIVNNAGAWYTLNADGTTAYKYPSAWNWDGDAAQWSRFWVIIYGTGIWTKTGTWGAGANWGPNTFGNPTWGSSATVEQVQSIQAIVDDWHPPHSKCMNIIVAFDAASFDPTGTAPPLPDGTWKNWSKIVAGAYVPARLSTAIYWDGGQAPS